MTIAIGDLQGCLDCLQRLLDKIDRLPAPPADPGPARTWAKPLWLTGDLVNRGPQSLDSLRWARRNADRVQVVLGNHDLHLLAVACGIRPAHRDDTLDGILAAPDRDELLDWLRRQPLAHFEHDHLMVHAGVMPQWTVSQTLACAAEVQDRLAGDEWTDFLATMYGNKPARWDDRLQGADRQRVIVNALTRMRFCTSDGEQDFKMKDGPGCARAGYQPWFEVAGRRTADVTVVFGHWSTLGLLVRPRLLGLDTGCVWGGRLTGVRLQDRLQLDVSCPQAVSPD